MFSLDSIITTVGMTDIVVIAMIAAMTVMLLAANPLANFINNNPTVVLAFGFLLMIGIMLIAEGFGARVPKGYIYGAMAFSALVEDLNMLSRRTTHKADGPPSDQSTVFSHRGIMAGPSGL